MASNDASAPLHQSKKLNQSVQQQTQQQREFVAKQQRPANATENTNGAADNGASDVPPSQSPTSATIVGGGGGGNGNASVEPRREWPHRIYFSQLHKPGRFVHYRLGQQELMREIQGRLSGKTVNKEFELSFLIFVKYYMHLYKKVLTKLTALYVKNCFSSII